MPNKKHTSDNTKNKQNKQTNIMAHEHTTMNNQTGQSQNKTKK